jgi:signal transduction histidine kinase
VRFSLTRPRFLLLAGVLPAFALAAAGWLWELARFGPTAGATGARVESFVRRAFDQRQRELSRLVDGALALAPTVNRALSDRDALPQVFSGLVDLTSPARGTASLTIYTTDFRTLAWSDGPAEDLAPERLRGGESVFVTEGTLGLRLVHVKPLRLTEGANAGRLVGTAAAETLLSLTVGGSPERHLAFPTPYGDVTLVLPTLSSAADNLPHPNSFLLRGPTGAPLVEARFDPAEIQARRRDFRRVAMAIAGVPIVLYLLWLCGPALAARRAVTTRRAFAAWSLGLLALVTAGAAGAWALAALAGGASLALLPIVGLVALAAAAVGPVSWWLRRRKRHAPATAPMRFVLEQLTVAIVAAVFLLVLVEFLAWRISAAPFDQWEYPLLPLRWSSTLGFAGILLAISATIWCGAALFAIAAERWRLAAASGTLAAGVLALWIAGMTGAALVWQSRGLPLPVVGFVSMAAAIAAFGLAGAEVRRRYRRTTQSARLTLLYLGLFAPVLFAYPAAQWLADAGARRIIETEYARAVQRAAQPEHLQDELAAAQAEIDAMPDLEDLVNRAPQTPTQAAYSVWSQTRLSENRVTSAIELYDDEGALVSRFALNVPEYGAPAGGERISGCGWVQSGEAGRFGAEERRMLRGERALCRPDGTSRGAIVVHLMPDYRALPFVASDDPYYDVLRPGSTERGARIGELQVAVYGWGLLPTFASGNVAWPLTADLADRLTMSRAPFWTDLPSGDRRYHVLFSNDRGGIYAVGYPEPTWFDHLTRLAEAATILFIVFVVLLVGATAFGPFTRRREAPLRILVKEVRTSFYRKLFLYFLLAAVGPVVALALTFGAYMADKFRADIENEATNVVTVARRVFEELLTIQDSAPTDDVLVWIGQAINQDVNLFVGSQLVATSQRDLFDSGLLPTRTPASIYRGIALNRLPSYTGDDRIGGFSYLIAASPIPSRGREAILSVPLALRQREITREIDDLNRGVLVGAAMVVVLVAGLGLYVANRVSTPVSRLTRATRQIAAGRLDVRIAADTADELRRLVEDFNLMAATLAAQRDELARTNQLKAWAEMARQVAHEIKNPLTPIQLSAEHLRRVHADRGQPLGPVFEQCLDTILAQVRLLRQIAGEFSNYAATPTASIEPVDLAAWLPEIVAPYQIGTGGVETTLRVDPALPAVSADRTLLARAITNIIENARQAMPSGGAIRVTAARDSGAGNAVAITIADTGVGMDDLARARAFEPYFSTKTAGSGLGLPNAKRNVELCGGSLALESAPGRGTSITIRLRPAARGDSAAG